VEKWVRYIAGSYGHDLCQSAGSGKAHDANAGSYTICCLSGVCDCEQAARASGGGVHMTCGRGGTERSGARPCCTRPQSPYRSGVACTHKFSATTAVGNR